MICDTHPGLQYYHWLPLFSSAILRRLVCLHFWHFLPLVSYSRLSASSGTGRAFCALSLLLPSFLVSAHILATPLAGKSCVHCLRAMCVASHHGTIVLYHAPVLCCGTFHTDYGCFTGGIPGQGHCAPWFLPCVSTGCISPLGLCTCFLGIALVVA